jgi:hypothetical protein
MKERFNNLPEDAQQAIQAFDYDGALKSLHTQYNLHIDQASTLEQIVANIMFGDRRPQSLVTEIETGLRVTHEQAVTIAVDVNKKILMPIQENMKEIQFKNEV